MTSKRILEAAQILGELGNGKMANELTKLADRYRWIPISEIHEDYGDCVLVNVGDCGYMEIGSNITNGFDESQWTHFTRFAPIGQEEYERTKAETSA